MQIVEEAQEVEGSASGQSTLSAMERIFCDVFIGNGGKATEAAIAAGYSEHTAHVSACRLLCRKRVAAYIKDRCVTFVHTALAVAIRTLVDAAADENALWKDRIKAANSLIEMAGLMPSGPGVQVNVGVQMNGAQAQAIITSVHEARSRRLSDIPPAMPDTFDEDMATLEAAALPSPESVQEGPGGGEFQGPVAGSVPLPAPSTENRAKLDVSCECPKCLGVDDRAT